MYISWLSVVGMPTDYTGTDNSCLSFSPFYNMVFEGLLDKEQKESIIVQFRTPLLMGQKRKCGFPFGLQCTGTMNTTFLLFPFLLLRGKKEKFLATRQGFMRKSRQIGCWLVEKRTKYFRVTTLQTGWSEPGAAGRLFQDTNNGTRNVLWYILLKAEDGSGIRAQSIG